MPLRFTARLLGAIGENAIRDREPGRLPGPSSAAPGSRSEPSCPGRERELGLDVIRDYRGRQDSIEVARALLVAFEQHEDSTRMNLSDANGEQVGSVDI